MPARLEMERIQYCLDHYDQLTPWGKQFIDSLSKYEEDTPLSIKQRPILIKITSTVMKKNRKQHG